VVGKAWSWIGRTGVRSWQRTLSIEAGPPPVIKLATVPPFSFAAIGLMGQDSTAIGL